MSPGGDEGDAPYAVGGAVCLWCAPHKGGDGPRTADFVSISEADVHGKNAIADLKACTRLGDAMGAGG